MLIGSLTGAPLGIAEIFFIDYWMPSFEKFELAPHLYLEDIILCFALGGLSVGTYMALRGKKQFALKPWFIVAIPCCIAIALLDPFRWTFMNYMLASMAAGAVYVLIVHPSRKVILASAIINNAIYIVPFAFLWFAFPSLHQSYLFENLLGIGLFGIPLEELVWVGLFAAIWSPTYESLAAFIKKGKSTDQYSSSG